MKWFGSSNYNLSHYGYNYFDHHNRNILLKIILKAFTTTPVTSASPRHMCEMSWGGLRSKGHCGPGWSGGRQTAVTQILAGVLGLSRAHSTTETLRLQIWEPSTLQSKVVQGGHGQEYTTATQISGVKVPRTRPMSPRVHTSPSEADTLPGNAAEDLETADLGASAHGPWWRAAGPGCTLTHLRGRPQRHTFLGGDRS